MSHRNERVGDDFTPDESQSESFWGGSFFDEQFKFNEGFGLDYLTVGGCGSLAIW